MQCRSKMWPTSFGAGAPTFRIVDTTAEPEGGD
jgi:hypothetical protein